MCFWVWLFPYTSGWSWSLPHCLGIQHAEEAFVDSSFSSCGEMNISELHNRLRYVKHGGVPLLLPRSSVRPGYRAALCLVELEVIYTASFLRCSPWRPDVYRCIGGWALSLRGWPGCVARFGCGSVVRARPRDDGYAFSGFLSLWVSRGGVASCASRDRFPPPLSPTGSSGLPKSAPPAHSWKQVRAVTLEYPLQVITCRTVPSLKLGSCVSSRTRRNQVSVTLHTQTPPPAITDQAVTGPRPGPSVFPCCPTARMSVAPLALLARSLGAWLALPSPSRWLLRTIRLGYAIQVRPPSP